VELGHPEEIEEDEGDAAAAEEVVEALGEPALVADLEGELEARRQLREELFERLELVGLEVVRKLEDEGAALGAEQVHDAEEFSEFGLAADEPFLVGDDAGDLGGEDEVGGGVALPLADHGFAGGPVPGGVDFDGVEPPGVMGEEFPGLGARRVERPAPGVGRPAGRPHPQAVLFVLHHASYSRIRIPLCSRELSNGPDAWPVPDGASSSTPAGPTWPSAKASPSPASASPSLAGPPTGPDSTSSPKP